MKSTTIKGSARLDYRPKLALLATIATLVLADSFLDFSGSASSRRKSTQLTPMERHLKYDQTQGFSETLLPLHLKEDHGGIAYSYSRDIDNDGKPDRVYAANDGSVFMHLTSLESPLKGLAYAPSMFLMAQAPTRRTVNDLMRQRQSTKNVGAPKSVPERGY
jgi:hypothetical protein